MHCSCQENDVLPEAQEKQGDTTNQDSDRLFDLSCSWQLEIPPVWANSSRTVDAAALARNGRSRQHDALDGVALTVRNSH
jgi:hypothetical protein